MCGVLLTVADVSDRKRLEDELRLAHKMEAVGRLSGGIAHDFNNLLTIINGYTTIVADEVRSNAYALGLTEEILNAGNRAAEMVSQLMSFSRRQVIKPESLQINEVVRDVERMLSRLIGEHIDVRTVLDPAAGWILADQNHIVTILINLATNARDAMPKGGVLTIETGPVTVHASSNMMHEMEAGEYVRLVVRDSGHGIDPVVRQHLFEPFFTTKARGKGTGLGLSSVYGSVQQNKGHIFVDTKIGEGTAFSIYLPRHQPVSTAQPERSIARKRPSKNEAILLVEDEAALRRMLRETLSKAGYRVWEAANGAEALHTWETMHGEFDLVVTDVVMPVMNGLELSNELGARCPDLRVMYMSGHAEDVITNHGVAVRGVDLLPKPFLPEVLVQRVRVALDRMNTPIRGETSRTTALV
jgi:nitrogen-specific signal transduction histidine kinase/ActR/RegA family two-component response regulator